mmetsp:Transcript_32657/g.92618  ORF Transcript_32657/g.92618 Transcript_32657/m.92618 type:complete len:295 (-) Transcript_32657:457-1341(-)
MGNAAGVAVLKGLQATADERTGVRKVEHIQQSEVSLEAPANMCTNSPWGLREDVESEGLREGDGEGAPQILFLGPDCRRRRARLCQAKEGERLLLFCPLVEAQGPQCFPLRHGPQVLRGIALPLTGCQLCCCHGWLRHIVTEHLYHGRSILHCPSCRHPFVLRESTQKLPHHLHLSTGSCPALREVLLEQHCHRVLVRHSRVVPGGVYQGRCAKRALVVAGGGYRGGLFELRALLNLDLSKRAEELKIGVRKAAVACVLQPQRFELHSRCGGQTPLIVILVCLNIQRALVERVP